MRHFIQFNGSGTLNFELPTRHQSGSVVATIYDHNGSTLVSSASVVTGSTNQALYADATAGATFLSASYSASLQKGKRFLVGVSEEQNGEMVTVKNWTTSGVSHHVVNLMRPLIFSHTSASYFQDTNVAVTIPTSCTTLVDKNFYCKLEYNDSNGTAQDAIVKSFDVTRFIPVTTLSIEDLRDFDPQLGKKGLVGLNVNNLIKKAWEQILARVGARSNMGGIVGSVDLTVPHSYLTRRLMAELDPEQKEFADMLSQRFNEEFESILNVTPVDRNGDGVLAPNERFTSTIVWRRS